MFAKTDSSIPKVRILVVGDSGVGKTTLVHQICHNKPLKSHRWTVGCSVDVKLFEYESGKNFFIEFWDIGGAKKYKSTRSLFYQQINGILLVYDTTNSKSYHNLRKWIKEIVHVNKQQSIEEKYMFTGDLLHVNHNTAHGMDHHRWHTITLEESTAPLGHVLPLFGQDAQDNTYSHSSTALGSLPVFVVGNKVDMADSNAINPQETPYNTMKDFGLDSAHLSATHSLVVQAPKLKGLSAVTSLSPSPSSSSSSVAVDLEKGGAEDPNSAARTKLDQFFARVIERRYFRAQDRAGSGGDTGSAGGGPTSVSSQQTHPSQVYARRDSHAHTTYMSITQTHISRSVYSGYSPSTTPQRTAAGSSSIPEQPL